MVLIPGNLALHRPDIDGFARIRLSVRCVVGPAAASQSRWRCSAPSANFPSREFEHVDLTLTKVHPSMYS
jgi:hypothetical protein